MRVRISTSAWSAQPLATVSGPVPCTSGSHSPLPSAWNLATYSVP